MRHVCLKRRKSQLTTNMTMFIYWPLAIYYRFTICSHNQINLITGTERGNYLNISVAKCIACWSNKRKNIQHFNRSLELLA